MIKRGSMRPPPKGVAEKFSKFKSIITFERKQKVSPKTEILTLRRQVKW
jgi:hypothetical protein